jgi:thioredoxin reductase
MVDAVIVGGGIAGLSAALFLARAGRSTIVYDAGRSRIFAVERIREFVGFDGWTPDEMLTKAREEVLRYGAQIRSGMVTKIESRSDGLFDVFAPDVTITARSIVLVTGVAAAIAEDESLSDRVARSGQKSAGNIAPQCNPIERIVVGKAA